AGARVKLAGLRTESGAAAGAVDARALVEPTDVARTHAGVQTGECVVEAGVELDLRSQVPDRGRAAAQVVAAGGRDHAARRLRLTVVNQVCRIKQESEAPTYRRQRVTGGEVDPAGLRRADVLVEIEDVGDASKHGFASDPGAIRVVRSKIAAVE